MPELPEVEAYRRLAEQALTRPIAAVLASDHWFLKGGLDGRTVAAALVGRQFEAARRIGKLLVLDVDGGPSLGVRFGMTGRLIVDGTAGVDRLVYSSDRELEAWDRFAVQFEDGGDMRVRDPRRLGGVMLDPNEDALGPDARVIGVAALRDALAGSVVSLKARLMDQSRVAGIGNLLADEILWRAALSPVRPASSLDKVELRRLHSTIRRVIEQLIDRGGSHTGDAYASRAVGGMCPRDGTPMRRETVGGRTTWWCPIHQT